MFLGSHAVERPEGEGALGRFVAVAIVETSHQLRQLAGQIGPQFLVADARGFRDHLEDVLPSVLYEIGDTRWATFPIRFEFEYRGVGANPG